MICRNISGCYAQRDRNFFLSLLSKATSLSHLTQTHAQIILNGYQNDLATVTKLTHKFSDLKAIRHSRDLFLSIPKPDLFLFNVLIRGFASNASPLSSLSLYTHLRKNTSLNPDKFTYAFAISAASGFKDEKYGLLLHAHSIFDGLGSNLYVGSIIVDFYFKFSRVELAQKVFDGMPEKDTVLWNTMISGLVRNCYYADSMRIFRDMVVGGTAFDSTTLATELPALAELQELKAGMGIHCLALKVGFHSDVHVLTGLVSLYSKCRELETARLLFGHITQPDLICYNAMIAGYTCNNETVSSVSLFRELLASGEKVNSSTIVGLIPVSSPFGHLHTHWLSSNFLLNEIELAWQLFDESPEKTLASWNAMISGYTQNGLTEAAISLFREMMSEFSPNPVTVTSILSACAQLGAISLGKWVHGLIKSKNLESNIYVLTALVDMYAKCGSIVEARKLFDLMTEKNVVTWNAMILLMVSMVTGMKH
ncbi:pentatricopeptide repeat-containing protein [Prunus yedoensis var. nudiflora]|uniref:Pentatricopeptide repeat-containing protein n=1 Tax=Prunus yedoensis var. nudiflora TaxID=2094558 RepID=A0A314Z994_PRUYE|nr:pentatricopeptide repeat-containing protein [Prunus yedoensis var. nudiflora]